MKKIINQLKNWGACEEGLEYAIKSNSVESWWNDCERGDWLLWVCGKLAGEPGSEKRKKLVLTACQCARLALKHVPADEGRPLKAIETAEKWAKGDTGVNIEDVRKAAAADAADDYARKQTLKNCADIARKEYTWLYIAQKIESVGDGK